MCLNFCSKHKKTNLLFITKNTRRLQDRGFRRKRIIIEAREKKGYVCTEEIWGYCTLTNEINAGGYLYWLICFF